MSTMTKENKPRSRLEINYSRLLEEAQLMANGSKPKGWLFESEKRHLTILYGSETGTAQEVAERIGREAYRHFFTTSISTLNDVNIDNLTCCKLAVFVVATTGQGDDPENMKNFFKTLWKLRNNRQLLNKLEFGVIGLGDSSYQKFNFSSKRINKLLMYMGASSLVNIGLGDDQHDHGPDHVIDSWLQQWWGIVNVKFPLPVGVQPMNKITLLPPKFKCIFSKQNDPNVTSSVASSAPVHTGTLLSNIPATASDHFQDVRLLSFDVSEINPPHKPGDVLVVQPQNLPENVDTFLELLGLSGDDIFSLKPWDTNSKLPPTYLLPQPCTIREFVTMYLDIQSIPKRLFFEILSFFTTDELEKEKFIEFTTTEGQEDLHNYCTRPRRSTLEVLADFPHTPQNIPFDYLLDLIPPIRPRSYSIASSSLTLPGKAQILVALVNYRTVLSAPRRGLCSNWLAGLQPGDTAPVWIKRGSLRFPDVHLTSPSPVVMIGPGTGCAPFQAYIQECVSAGKSQENVVMIFGCRNKNKDYFFRDEWEALVANKQMTLFCAFSRDQADKIYVQHVMRKNADFLWKLLSDHTTQIFYAGNAKRIPIDVHEALEFICQTAGGLDPDQTQRFMKNSIEKRYQSESWA